MHDTNYERQREHRYQDFVHRTADTVGILTDWLAFSEDVEPETDDDAQWLAALRDKTRARIEHLTNNK